MKIAFVLPGRGEKPSGGFKVVYEYANGLARRGHEVTVIHAARSRVDTPFIKYPDKALHFLYRALNRSYGPDGWFDIDDRVILRWVPSLKSRYIPHGDAIVATAWDTTGWVSRYPTVKGRKFYLIQHLETFMGVSEELMNSIWRLPLEKIVVSRWLQELVEEIGEKAVYIPNGLDFHAFGVDRSKAASPSTVMMMYSRVAWKGSADGLKALSLVRERVPSLKALLFGIEPSPEGLPGWISYYHDPPQDLLRTLYNQAAVFVGPSWTEGWGLPPAEAMMCGCAVAATDIGGHAEFAEDEVTALLSPARDPARLADNIQRLIQDEALRRRVAQAGHANIQSFTWDRALDAFERAIDPDT